MQTLTKRCPRCGVEKDRLTEWGTSGWCKACMREYMRGKYQGDAKYREAAKASHRLREKERRMDPVYRDSVNAALRERRANDPEYRARKQKIARDARKRAMGKHLACSAKVRAKRDGREYALSPKLVQGWWESSPTCAYCTKSLRVGDGEHSHDSPTLDRVDTMQGYIPENVVLACFRCNTLKRDATLDELDTLVKNIRRIVTDLTTA